MASNNGVVFCTCCGRPLKEVAWLELDQRSQTYHDWGGVPAERSQGWFPFGMKCARNALKVHGEKMEDDDDDCAAWCRIFDEEGEEEADDG